ncbi:pimeloyl-ACP methyl ester carboxylesterase [Microbacterium sp. ZKA21]|uniref:alpha/beta fold hydrolase n=1 Tax=Microbacterium sp. ZKA21 TaxID=3381694 RepID=UPI003D1F4B47
MTAVRRLARGRAEIAFEDSGGAGPPVVLCHGAGMDRSMFAEQAAALTGAGFRVIAWDLPAHGESMLPAGTRFTASVALEDLTALLDACGIDRAVLVGHSLGGNLAQAFVRAHPQRAAGLIVMDSTWNAGPLAWWERLALRLAAPSLALVPAHRLPGLMARASAVTSDAIARTEATFARMPKPVFLDVWRATVSFVDPDPEYRTPVPLALVRGAQDRTGNIATAMPAWARAEGVLEHVVPDAGHIVTWDAPEESARVLVGILEAWGSAGRDGA